MHRFLCEQEINQRFPLFVSRHQCHPLHPADRDEDPQECPEGKERGAGLRTRTNQPSPRPYTPAVSRCENMFVCFCLAQHLAASFVIEFHRCVLEEFLFLAFIVHDPAVADRCKRVTTAKKHLDREKHATASETMQI